MTEVMHTKVPVSLTISSIQIRGCEPFSLSPDGVAVIVGPNNSGKTTMLRDILKLIRSGNPGRVVEEMLVTKTGSSEEVIVWMEEKFYIGDLLNWENDLYFQWMDVRCRRKNVPDLWNSSSLQDLAYFMCSLDDVESRLDASRAPEPINQVGGVAKHPIHVALSDDSIERRLHEYAMKAFRNGVTLDRSISDKCRVRFGAKPVMQEGEDRVTPSYLLRLAEVPELSFQGHGVRSFLGCLLLVLTSPALIHLIDEPEVFLHPPHARLLGRLLAKSKPRNRQLLLATHSGDLLRGILDAASAELKILRLTRQGDVNRICELSTAALIEAWSDPIIRMSNVLDGIFHDRVIICEAESDSQFYGAVMRSVQEGSNLSSSREDVMFVSSGGKDKTPALVKALTMMGVNTHVIADFDILNNERPLRQVVEGLGGQWNDVATDWKLVKSSVEQKMPPLSVSQVRNEIEGILDMEKGGALSTSASDKIRQSLKQASPWGRAKESGVNAISSGEAAVAANQLLETLRKLGLHVVPVGELERFVRSVGNHGPAWVAGVMQKDLLHDQELAAAREFVVQVLA